MTKLPFVPAARLAAVAAFTAASLSANAAETPEPYPTDYWAMRSVISNVELSPDGKRLAMMEIPSKDGKPLISVYDANDLAKEPFRLNADPMEVQGFTWISDRYLLFQAKQAVRDIVRAREQDTFKYKAALLDIEKKKIDELGGTLEQAAIASILPSKPDKVLLEMVPPGQVRASDFAKRVAGAFSPYDYYEYDLKKGTKKLLFQGRLARGGYAFTAEGEAWLAGGTDVRKREVLWFWKPGPDADWQEVRRQPIDDFEFDPFYVVGLDDENPNHALVLTRNGHDKMGMWSYDLAGKKLGELIYRRSDVDVAHIWHHSNSWQHPATVVGVVYYTDKRHIEFFDATEGATQAAIEGLVPHAHNVSIPSRSRDGDTFVIYNVGPRDPGTYYLFKDGEIKPIGSRQPLFESERLADVEFVSYEARDGRKLYAYVTVPHGEPPFPLIVMPHGGPSVRDIGGYDEWAQALANNGYLVVQPQYRGSTGLGADLQKAMFENGGQMGHKMQDDKDDAALYLVQRGLADKNRLAMFGWSYGGYAAGVAATRTPQLYQCVIAGAAVLNRELQYSYSLTRFEGESRKRYQAVSNTAVNPIDEVEKVNVPMLIVHGVVDYRVLVKNARDYVKQLDEHGKSYKYVELPGAGHFTNTLRYDHKLEFYQSMLDFLAEDCGPEGL